MRCGARRTGNPRRRWVLGRARRKLIMATGVDPGSAFAAGGRHAYEVPGTSAKATGASMDQGTLDDLLIPTAKAEIFWCLPCDHDERRFAVAVLLRPAKGVEDR